MNISLDLHAKAGRQRAWLIGAYKALHPSNFDPSQQRVPAGNPDGGQWTRVAGPGAARPHGHHYVPQSIYKNFRFPMTLEVYLKRQRPAAYIMKETTFGRARIALIEMRSRIG